MEDKCCEEQCDCEKKTDFWWWFQEKEATFTVKQVKELCEKIKEFNAGAIDEYLTRHVDKVTNTWLDDNKAKN